jgi:Flp pilus assembly protein TadG
MLPACDRPARPTRLISRFRRSEDGTISIFVLILFTLMIMMGGFAVDLMRTEYVRNSLQQSLDRCTLAAAALNQELDPETVCRDYVAKAGHSDDLTSVTVSEGLNFREVSVDAVAVEQPFFAQMVGVDQFDVPSASVAEQRITDIEIAMVLDVSGSMINTPTRITNLRVAAKEFIQTVLETDVEQRTSIAIVPFNGQVMLGPLLAPKFNVTLPNGAANMTCVDLPAAGYTSPGLSRTLALPMTANADSFSGTGGAGSSGTTPTDTTWRSPTDTSHATLRVNHSASPILDNRWCPPFLGNQIRLPGNNIATLQGYIDGLVPVGATSINAGMRWGLALLDPTARPMFSEFVSANQMPAAFNGRPFDYMADGTARPDMMKVIVLMTDGEHFAEERINDTYKAGLSPIYRGADGQYSIRHTTCRNSGAGSNEFWTPHRDPDGNSGNGIQGEWRSAAWAGGGTAVQQTWPQVWSNVRVSWVAWQLYARGQLGCGTASNRYTHWIGQFRTNTPTATMDTQLQQVCTMAKDRNVIVFGIAFEAPVNGQTQIRECARQANGNTNNYFEVAGAELRTAFRTIAAQISQLRLTQ